MSVVARPSKLTLATVLWLGCLVAWAPAQAQAPAAEATPGSGGLLGEFSLRSQRDPIAVSADRMELDYRERVVTYAGSVIVTQADLKLEADSLRIVLDPAAKGDAQIREIIAEGNVRMRKGARWATSGRAVFDQKKRVVTLKDDAVLHDDANQIRGDSVVVYLDEERSVVEGGKGRVQAVLYPNREPTKGEGGR